MIRAHFNLPLTGRRAVQATQQQQAQAQAQQDSVMAMHREQMEQSRKEMENQTRGSCCMFDVHVDTRVES